MSEFDINLIRAFAKCPAFYDKRNPNFKDRIFTENAWKELSLQLGFDDKILRDRMFQLRNRYNLEKRKVEMMVQDGETDAKSTWPLFEYMTFLDGHIRPRKSYKSIMSRAIDANHHPHHHPHNQQHPMNTNSVLMPRHSTNFRNYNPLNMALNRSLMQQQQRQQQPFYNMAGMQQDQQLHQSLVDCDIDLSGTLASNGIIGDEDKGGHFYQPNPGQNGMNGDSGMMPSTSYEASDNTSDIKMELFSDTDDEEGNDMTNDDEENNNSRSSNQNNNTNPSSNNNNGNGPTNGQQQPSSNQGAAAGNGAQQQQQGGGDDNDEDVHFINPVDLLTTTSLKSMQNQQNNFSLNVRQMEALKRTAAAAAAAVSGQDHQQSPSTGQHQQQMNHHSNSLNFKRRRRNYHQMVINGVNNPHFSSTDHGPSPSSSSHHHHNQGGQTLNSSMRPARPNSLLPNSAQMAMMAMNGLPNSAQMSSHHHSTAFPASLFCANPSPGPLDKYSAFGQFVASSLAELPELKALDIVAKFTSHLIHALREHKTDSQSVDDKQRTF